MQASFKFQTFDFKIPGGTSRGVLKAKDSWFLKLTKDGRIGIGECSLIYGLSIETKDDVSRNIQKLCDKINNGELISDDFFERLPALKFAWEMANLDLINGGHRKLFDCAFLNGKAIPINGLVWMGSKDFMYNQLIDKIEKGFKCIKIKIAAIDFEEELELLRYIRSEFNEGDIEIRVDANGGFKPEEALQKLQVLSSFKIHSIEQPIPVKLWDQMANLCSVSELPIALDEELIGISDTASKKQMLETINPNYIILKPSLIGGVDHANEWIDLANELKIKWWATSALESNIGLNAISQWISTKETDMYQGLGTGQLFANNFNSPLVVSQGEILYKGIWALDKFINEGWHL